MEYNLKHIAGLCKLITVCISRKVYLKKRNMLYIEERDPAKIKHQH